MTVRAAPAVSLALLLALPAGAQAAGRRHALLIGVGNYTHDVTDLEGPPHDIEALKKALVEQWGFAPADVRVVLDAQATRDGILAAIDALSTTTAPGDFVFLYYSGHGTSSFELSDIGLDGNTGALVPADFMLQSPDLRSGLIVGSRDLRPRLEALDRDRQIFAVFDACYSGAAVRSLRAVGKPRYISLPTRGLSATFEDEAEDFGALTAKAPPYPYSNVLYISAASKSEAARDVTSHDIRAGRVETVDGRPHGALTNALLGGLGGASDTNRDGTITYDELYQYLRDEVSDKFPQQPQLLVPEATADAFRAMPVLGQSRPPAPPPAPPTATGPAALKVRLEGLPATLEQKIRAIPGVALAEAYDLLVARESSAFRLYHGSGDLLSSFDFAEAAEVVTRVAREVALRELVELSYPDQRFNVSVGIPGNRGFLTKGEIFSIEFRSEQPAHILLLNIDNGGHVGVLYPFEPEELAPTRSGSFGASGELKVSPPFGTEYLMIFAFEQKPAGFDEWLGKSFDPLGPELERLLAMLKGARGGRAQGRLKVVTRETSS